MLDMTNVDFDSAYHNWLERNGVLHSPEIEHAFKGGWNVLSNFIEGPEQKAVDWHIVSEATGDAISDCEGHPGEKALERHFVRHNLLVLHKATIPATPSP